MRRTAGKETWHRLLNWDRTSADSERLAALILAEEGYQKSDPAHPNGGPDSKHDLICHRGNEVWIGSAYFPNGQRSFTEIKTKFKTDSIGIATNNANGIIFITNQELTLGEREQLQGLIEQQSEIYHLERIAHILNRPKCYGIRLEYLDIDMSKEEQLAYHAALGAEVARLVQGMETLLRRSAPISSETSDSVIAYPIQSYNPLGIGGRKVHYCICGYGFFVTTVGISLHIYNSEGFSIKCPKCSRVEVVRNL